MALANGERLVGVVGFEVDNNSFYAADTFHITLCLSAQPASRNWAYWAQQVDVEMELLLGYPSNPNQYDRPDLTSLIIGSVDEMEIDPIKDEIIMSGRDLTARFADNKTVDRYPTLTASQIATKLALLRGLTPVVTATTVLAGTYYDIDHLSVADDRPEWDLLTYLARVSNFVVYVKGRELHFEPKSTDTTTRTVIDKVAARKRWAQLNTEGGAAMALSKLNIANAYNLLANRLESNNADERASLLAQAKDQHAQALAIQAAAAAKYYPEFNALTKLIAGPDYIETGTAYTITWTPPSATNPSPTLNAVDLVVSRNLTIAKDIVVSVRSYNIDQNKGFTMTASRPRVRSGTKTAAKSYIAPLKRFFVIANKSAQETQQYANQRLAEISSHEMNLTVSLPGDPTLNPRTVVRLTGTGTAFDQSYYPASVLHAISIDSGYRMTIRAKNSSPESTVAP